MFSCCLVTGSVTAPSGAPIGRAVVSARSVAVGAARSTPVSATSDESGAFKFDVPSGLYRVGISVDGFEPTETTLRVTQDARLDIGLEPLDSPRLRRIAHVRVDGRLSSSEGAPPSVTLTRDELDALGSDRLVDDLADLPGVTFSRPDGGAASAVSVVSLRGPDPSESLIALDGQLLNDGNTGDLDVSRIPVSVLSAVDVAEGLGPRDINGSNTFGGSINLVSVRPTQAAHQAASYSAGSFGRTSAWLDATGTVGRLGYAGALDDSNEAGYTSQTVNLFSNSDPTCFPCRTHLGSAVAARTAVGSLDWTFSRNADVEFRAFALGDHRDQSAAVNGIDENAADQGAPQSGGITGPGPQTFSQSLRAYQLRGRAPFGAGELSAEASTSDDSVSIDGGSNSPYDLDHRDRRTNIEASWSRSFATSDFTLGGYRRFEDLRFVAPPSADGSTTPDPVLGQSISVLFVRGGFEPAPKIRLDAGLFESRYTTFGSNLDGRFQAVYSIDPRTRIDASVGSGFRAPLLAERYAFPASELAMDGNNVFIGQGSASERPEHATEYELGATRRLSPNTRADVSLYVTNLRDPVEVFYPLEAVESGRCSSNSYTAPVPGCVSYQSNVGNAVYEGLETSVVERLGRHVVVTGRYGLNIAYPKDLNAQFSNPTSGGNLVDGEQFLGIAQQQGALQVDYSDDVWHARLSSDVRGKNNELNAGPFVVANAVVGRAVGRGVEVSLTAMNLFSAVSGRYTVFGAGSAYRGLVGGASAGLQAVGDLPTDALHVEPLGISAALTLRR